MPLTFVIEHLNHQLRDLHPRAALSRHAAFEYQNQEVQARLGELQLIPLQTSVFRVSNAQPYARDSHLIVHGPSGHHQPAESLYLQAWDAEDVIFLDRFLRTLHALHHVSLQQDRPAFDRLILDVHARHLSAVPGGHGQVFEGLLSNLGLTPGQIILRLNLSVSDDATIRQAVSNFAGRGYTLLGNAEKPDLQQLTWLNQLGIRQVSLNLTNLKEGSVDRSLVRKWTKLAAYQGQETLAEGLATPGDLNLLLDLGFQLVGGPLLSGGQHEKLLAAGKAGQLFTPNQQRAAGFGIGL